MRSVFTPACHLALLGAFWFNFITTAAAETSSTSLGSRSGAFQGVSGRFMLQDWGGRSDLPIHYQLPAALKRLPPDTPVLMVLTGRKRNADQYRDQWSDLASRYGFIVLSPEFVWSDWPDETFYDMGNVFDFGEERLKVPDLDAGDLSPVPETEWAFSAIEAIFDFVVADLGLTATGYSMYGHSSGAGFVHRFLYYKPKARLHYAVAANGAWYLLPRNDIDYPYGLAGSGVNRAMLKSAFRRRFTILFGQNDLGPRRQFHANTEQSKMQGPHVVSRAMNFLLLSLITAKQMKTPINWTIRSVANVGHSNSLMAPRAVEYLFPRLYLQVRGMDADSN